MPVQDWALAAERYEQAANGGEFRSRNTPKSGPETVDVLLVRRTEELLTGFLNGAEWIVASRLLRASGKKLHISFLSHTYRPERRDIHIDCDGKFWTSCLRENMHEYEPRECSLQDAAHIIVQEATESTYGDVLQLMLMLHRQLDLIAGAAPIPVPQH